jgi:serine/threonine protein kinase
MELVRGRTIEQQLQQGTPFGTANAARIGVDLCSAVSAVHGAGLLHRDIKAHNVMIAEDGRVVLMDLGTGREVDDGSVSDLAGTPLYVAPEVLRGEPATVRSDIYSLGVLLYYMVTGSYPVHGRTLGEIRHAHDTRDAADLRSARPDLPPRLARILERALDPDPARRYDSTDALGADLQAIPSRP